MLNQLTSFENCSIPDKPDYSNIDNWAAYPEKDAQQFLPTR